MKRSASSPSLAETGEKVACYGVSQGYYAVKTGVIMGTSSLGSCFALIAHKGAKVLFAHVQAGNTASSLKEVLEENGLDSSTIYVVRGVGFSEHTESIINKLRKLGLAIKEDHSDTATVVFDPFSLEKIKKPGTISPTNNLDYLEKNITGGEQETGSAIANMEA